MSENVPVVLEVCSNMEAGDRVTRVMRRSIRWGDGYRWEKMKWQGIDWLIRLKTRLVVQWIWLLRISTWQCRYYLQRISCLHRQNSYNVCAWEREKSFTPHLALHLHIAASVWENIPPHCWLVHHIGEVGDHRNHHLGRREVPFWEGLWRCVVFRSQDTPCIRHHCKRREPVMFEVHTGSGEWRFAGWMWKRRSHLTWSVPVIWRECSSE